jgi:hypothetical protein
MIIKVFNNVGKGPSRGPINYLLGKDKDGKEREPRPAILAGSKEAVAFLIDNNHRQQKYTSGVIAFRDNERPTAKQLSELFRDFRKTFLPGLDEDKAPVLMVRHLEKGNLEIHFLIAKQTSTCKALNIAPPGPASQRLFEDFQKVQNEKLGFKQVVPSLLKAQFDTFEKYTRKAKIGDHLIKKVKNNELATYSDLLRHLEQDLKIKITRRGKDFISVKMPGKEKAVRLKGPAFTPGADLKELLKQSSNQPTKLNPNELLKVQKSLENGINKRAEYNHKTYNTPAKNKGLNFKGSSNKNLKNIDVPKVVGQTTAQRPFEERVPVSNGIFTVADEFSTSKATQVSTQAKKQPMASSGPSASSGGGSGSGGSGSLSSKMLSLTALMNAEKDPVKKYQLLAQLIAVRIQRDQALSRENEAEKKRLSKIKIK